jgi:carbamoylphosphate synthase large subunit
MILFNTKNQKELLYKLGGNGFEISWRLSKYGIKIIGTSFDALDLAEDRGRFLNFWQISYSISTLQKLLMKLLL